MKKILPFFSYLFHPLFIPLYTVLCFFWLTETFLFPAEIFLIVIQVFIVMVLIPIAFYFLLRTLGKVDTVMISDVSQRRMPLFMQALLILLLLWQSLSPHRIPELYFFFLGALITTALCLGFAFARIKVSLHMAGLGAMLFFVIGVSIHSQHNAILLLAFLLIVTGMVSASRLEMNAHSHRELILGFASGFLPQIGLWYFWL
jgi:hypothetical protein